MRDSGLPLFQTLKGENCLHACSFRWTVQWFVIVYGLSLGGAVLGSALQKDNTVSTIYRPQWGLVWEEGRKRKKSTRKTIGKNVEANRELRIWDVSKKLKPSCGIKPCRVRGGLIIHRPHLGQFSLELLLYEKRQRGLWIIHDTTPSLFFPYWKETRNSSSFLFFSGEGGWYVYSPSCQEWDKKIDSTLVSER